MADKYKILAFSDFPSPYRVEVFRGLADFCDLDVVFDKISDQSRSSEWFVKNTGLNAVCLFDESGKKQYKHILKNLRHYDVVLAYDYHIKNAIILEFLCMMKKIPYIMNLDGAFIRKNPLKNILKRLLIKNASGYFASGRNVAEYFLHFGAKSDKIFYHPFTSLHKDEILNKPIDERTKSKIRKEIGLRDKKTVLSIGQFIPRKGFDVLIKAWQPFDVKYQLVIIGGGPEKDKYKELISEFGYKNVVVLDYMSKDKVKEYYMASDVFALATKEDIWGLVINEALAFGIPVVSTEMCIAAKELIINGKNGYVVQNTPEAIGVAIDKLMNADESVAYACIESILNYTYENVIDSHIKSINSIVNHQ